MILKFSAKIHKSKHDKHNGIDEILYMFTDKTPQESEITEITYRKKISVLEGSKEIDNVVKI